MNEEWKRRFNVYTCDRCRCSAVTVDLVEGATPFMIECIARRQPGFKPCKGTMQSSFYILNKHIIQDLKPTHEFYKPDDAEYVLLSLGNKDHVDKGGLLLRPISVKPDPHHMEGILEDWRFA